MHEAKSVNTQSIKNLRRTVFRVLFTRNKFCINLKSEIYQRTRKRGVILGPYT